MPTIPTHTPPLTPALRALHDACTALQCGGPVVGLWWACGGPVVGLWWLWWACGGVVMGLWWGWWACGGRLVGLWSSCCRVVLRACVVVWWSVSLWGATQVHRAPVSGTGDVGGCLDVHTALCRRAGRLAHAPRRSRRAMGASGVRKGAPEMLPGAATAGTRGARVTRPSVTGRATIGPPHQ